MGRGNLGNGAPAFLLCKPTHKPTGAAVLFSGVRVKAKRATSTDDLEDLKGSLSSATPLPPSHLPTLSPAPLQHHPNQHLAPRQPADDDGAQRRDPEPRVEQLLNRKR